MIGIIVSGCSGVGKSTIIRELLALHPEFIFSVSHTTRSKRAGEVDGADYTFISKEEFEKKIKEHFFIEWEEVYGNYYGTPRSIVESKKNSTQTVIFELDSKGALNLKEKFPQFTAVAILPPSIKVMLERLKERGTDTPEDTMTRWKMVGEEIHRLANLDYCIINDDLKTAVKYLDVIISAQRFKSDIVQDHIDCLIKETEEFNI